MSRSLFSLLVLVLIPASVPVRGNTSPLKNPVEIRVMSVAGDSVRFHIEVRGGALIRVGADGRWYDDPGGTRTTPAQLRAFPQGPGLLLRSDQGQRLHVEAWRMVGNSPHVSADGTALFVRTANPRSPPQVVPADTNTVR